MTFGDPWFLALLFPLALFILWQLGRSRGAVDGGSEYVLADLPRTLRSRTVWLPGLLLTLSAVLVIGALARPLRGREEARVITEGIDILLVVDTSSSMLQAGLQKNVTNLDVVKQVIEGFVKTREDDRIGLMSFAALPRTECPLTLDQDAIVQHLRAVRCVQPNGPEDGTAIGIAVGNAARKLIESDAKSKVIILLTDGEENVMIVDPNEAAALCKDLGIRVYTVGAGTQIERNPLFNTQYEVAFRTELLESIAATTGGRFFRAKDSEALAEVYDEISGLERTEREDIRYTDYDDLYHWLIIPAAALLLLEVLLRRGPYLELAA
jgi:Ca-activated chloride channel family protein